MSKDQERDDEHAAIVSTSPHGLYLRAQCSCDWVGTWVRRDQPFADHQAMSHWAAHAHVAAGLAVEE
jgi:hypothetical protein